MAKGQKTGGRVKGTPNKTTASIKGAITEAFDMLGGVPSLVDWGKEHPNEFFALWGRLAPREIEAKVDVTLLSPEERKQRLLALLGQ